MSGNDEKVGVVDSKLKCQRCGSTEYEYITYGYCVDIVDVEERTFYTKDFKPTEGEDWSCISCGTHASDIVRVILETERWYDWGK